MTQTTRNLLSICALYAVSLVAPSISQADSGPQQSESQQIAQAASQQPALQQTPQPTQPTQLVYEANCDEVAEIDMKCISDINAFVLVYDYQKEIIGYNSQTGNYVRGTKRYGARDKIITPSELIQPMVDVALMNNEAYKQLLDIDDPTSEKKLMRNECFYRMRKDLFDPLDINEDMTISIDDDLNGDVSITYEDKQLYEQLKQKQKERERKTKRPQRQYSYN
ncbi:hypothetical protein J4434_07410 [Candidatus Woesearchaeota archaeon]|nr:hypothetical protein [Candidatus Woesearchaeota archaeon]